VRSLGRTVGLPVNGSVARLSVGPFVAARTVAALRGFDVVHVHEPLQFAVSLAATSSAHHPVVGTFHAAADRLVLYSAFRPLFRKVLRRLDAAFAVSDAAADLVQRYFGFRPPIEPNGVDVARFADATALPERASVAGPVVLFLGRDEPRKGLDVLRGAWPSVRGRVDGAELWIAGPGTESVAGDGMRSFGAVSDEEVGRLYASADLYCSPARFGESFGLVLLEAMAAGTPVVASDIPGYAAVARGSLAGSEDPAARLVPKDDPESLADAIVDVLTHPEEAERLVGAGRGRAAEYDWPGLAARMAAHYERVLREVSRSGGRT
jgi:phosphatidylinositol alpha-mannosyltransferase